MLLQAVVTDFDATFADDQGVAQDPRTWASLARLRAAGVRTVLCTGRTLDYLVGPQGILSSAQLAMFDVIVAEDGAVAWEVGENRVHLLGEPMSPFFLDALRHPDDGRERGSRPNTLPIWAGQASVGLMRSDLEQAERLLKARNAELRRLGIRPISVHPIVNRGSVTYVSSDVNKGTGTLWALRRLEVSPTRTVGIGDGENDGDFLRLCAVAATVGNAVPELKGLPNAVHLRGHAAHGFRELVRRIFSGDIDERMRRSRFGDLPPAGKARNLAV